MWRGFREAFRRFARFSSDWLGAPSVFVLACASVAGWLLVGPVFAYSDTWQLTINTVTTVVTFLMVFVLQHTQNRDTRAIQLKLDELIRAVQEARTGLVDLEEFSDEELERLQTQFRELMKRERREKL